MRLVLTMPDPFRVLQPPRRLWMLFYPVRTATVLLANLEEGCRHSRKIASERGCLAIRNDVRCTEPLHLFLRSHSAFGRSAIQWSLVDRPFSGAWRSVQFCICLAGEWFKWNCQVLAVGGPLVCWSFLRHCQIASDPRSCVLLELIRLHNARRSTRSGCWPNRHSLALSLHFDDLTTALKHATLNTVL
ncbi:uncharacterized protein RCC_12272 [Ramularia collo-cygni]|uniref:Uncharacterized protein n=1 Tax=Ramularia collo-cygni TaxID=112498 RepID=A0A2D3V0E0_9PEZI|nr:uncharacterized protein RCC_12272 [Ramularia collo-cygni]CZT14969.1 uncharacterized protein RCC_12272 [Ramularia collo-cygni]